MAITPHCEFIPKGVAMLGDHGNWVKETSPSPYFFKQAVKLNWGKSNTTFLVDYSLLNTEHVFSHLQQEQATAFIHS